MRHTYALLASLLIPLTFAHADLTAHPRLYMTNADRDRIQAQKPDPQFAAIYANVMASADWCLTKTPRTKWIAPAPDDPIYENLYDRFYAMMSDMAITEHLAFAYAISGEERYGEAARTWTLACCRAWRPDADAEPDGGKAYAVMRLLKGVAVGYDMAYDRFTEAERAEIRAMLATTAQNYYQKYFTQPSHAGPGFHTHHATVEYSSFGVAALALLGDVPDAQVWLDATIVKFKEHLLPTGLAADGAQVEGATFWASTMQYRLFFMDALRRVTGEDLFKSHGVYMHAGLALASIADAKVQGWDDAHQTVVMEPSYGQINYYAPVLLALAREYRRSIYQRLALWDQTLGAIQETRYITPNRKEQLLFELGGYACLWYDPTVDTAIEPTPLDYTFPSVYQAYARSGWEPGGIVAAVGKGGEVVVHAGGTAVLVAGPFAIESDAIPILTSVEGTSTITWKDDMHQVRLTLHRPNRVELTWQGVPPDWTFWSLEEPAQQDATLHWGNVQLAITEGKLIGIDLAGFAPDLAVGNGKLALFDPAPKAYPLVSLTPSESGILSVNIQVASNE